MSNSRKLAAVAKPPSTAPTFDAVLTSITPRLTRMRLCVDGELVERLTELQEQIIRMTADTDFGASGSPSAKLDTELQDLAKRAAAAEVEFVFRPIGARRWRELVAAHPPRPEDRAVGGDFDTTSLPAAAMAQCCVEPAGATVELFEQLADKLTLGQWNELWEAVHFANVSSGRLPRR